MSQYLPNFNRNLKGKYNPDLGFVSIKAGSDAYLLEDEINELQWIQSDSIANLIRHITNSGCIDVPTPNDSTKNGGLIELGTNKLNAFSINNFDAIFNGFISRIKQSNNKSFLIQLTNPPIMGVRYDLVYLEFWFKELKQYDNIPNFGGFYNAAVNYDIIDNRMNLETTQRLQLQWAFRTHEDILYPDILNNNLTNITLNPYGPNESNNTSYKFTINNSDTNLFEAGEETSIGQQKLGTYNGMVYAIPLLAVKRINSSGYNLKYNTDGGVNYVDENSVSGRPDNKFSNVIYFDDIIDLRKKVLLGENSLNTAFLCRSEYEDYQLYVKEQIKEKVDDLQVEVDDLRNLINTETTNIKIELDEFKNELSTELTIRTDEINNELNNKFDTFAAKETADINELRDLLNSFNTYLSDFQFKFVTAVTNFDDNISEIKTELRTVRNYLGSIITGGIDSYLDKYGLDLFNNNSKTTSGGIFDHVTGVSSDGLKIAVGYDLSKEYSVLYTLPTPINEGSVGEYWINKENTYFSFMNAGSSNINLNLYSVTIDNTYISSNSDTSIYEATHFNGLAGTRITRNIDIEHDFIQIMPLENANGKLGEVYITIDDLGFTVYNTGDARGLFEWVVIDTKPILSGGKLKNVVIYNVNLNGDSGVLKTDDFNGSDFQVLISSVNVADFSSYIPGSIGDVSYSKTNTNDLIIENTGAAVGSVKVIVFKDNVTVGLTADEEQLYYNKYGIELSNNQIETSGLSASEGTEIITNYTSKSDYCVIDTYTGTLGDIGCTWIGKGNTSYFYNNSGVKDLNSTLFTLKVDNVVTFSNSNTELMPSTKFNGMTGTRINRTMNKSSDLVYIMSLESSINIGEIYITIDDLGFTVYNTGQTNILFEWIVIDTRLIANGGKLTNVLTFDIPLKGDIGNTINYTFDTPSYQVILSSIIIDNISTITAENSASIGDIALKINDSQSFTVYNSGKALGKVRALVFKNG